MKTTTTSHTKQQLLSALQQHIHHIIQFLKKEDSHGSFNKEYLYEKPWFLLLGEKNSGKTALIQQSALHFKQINANNPLVHSWQTKEAVFISLPGIAHFHDVDHDFWQQTFQLFKSARRFSPLDGILLIINLAEQLQVNFQKDDQATYHLQKLLSHLTNKAKTTIPIYTVYTHLDTIAGFNPFFADLSETQRQEAFGFLLQKTQSYMVLASRFNHEFQQLLQNLQQRLLPALHHERNIERRLLVNDFTLQLESLQIRLLQHIQKLHPDNDKKMTYHMGGLFFTSTQQEETHVDCLSSHINKIIPLNHFPKQAKPHKSKIYFSHQLLSSFLPNTYHLKPQTSQLIKKCRQPFKLILSGIGTMTLAATVLLTYTFNDTMSHFGRMEKLISQYSLLSQSSHSHEQKLQQAITTLVALSSVKNVGSQQRALHIEEHLFHREKEVTQLAQALYQQLLFSDILPLLNQHLENRLASQTPLPPSELYSSLKTYLMLAKPKHRDVSYIHNWLQHVFQTQYHIPAKQLTTVLSNMDDILKKPLALVNENQILVQKARKLLTSVSPAFLAYSIIKDKTIHQTKDILKKRSSLLTDYTDGDKIPFRYTVNGYKKIYTTVISQAIDDLTRGDWVLGKKDIAENRNQLLQQITTLYSADYTQWWNLFFYNAQIKPVTTLQEARQTIATLTQKESPLFSLLDSVRENIQPMTGNDELSHTFNQHVANQFQGLTQLRQKDIATLKKQLQSLDKQLQGILDPAKGDRLAFEFAKKRFLHPKHRTSLQSLEKQSETLPEPLRTWFTQLTQASWKLVLQHAQHYAQNQWEKDILAHYQKKLAHRYPLNPNATETVSLREFKQFFKRNGRLDQYVTTYLHPFLHMEKPQWEAKKIDGYGLHLSDALLQQLIRAHLIQTMFFNQQNKLLVNFDLKPVRFSSGIDNIILDVNGKKIFDYPGSTRTTHFTWPQKKTSVAALELHTKQAGQIDLKKQGPWALFELLSQAQFKELKDTQHYELTFKQNKDTVAYQLRSDKKINPFIPHIVDRFVLPEQLA